MFAPDPGGVFASDTHRRVLGHLSLPSDLFGWSLHALETRIGRDDRHTQVATEADIVPVLDGLVGDGLAELVAGVYRQTAAGAAALVAPIAGEPGLDPDSSLVKPALIGGPVKVESGPTQIPVGSTEVTS